MNNAKKEITRSRLLSKLGTGEEEPKSKNRSRSYGYGDSRPVTVWREKGYQEKGARRADITRELKMLSTLLGIDPEKTTAYLVEAIRFLILDDLDILGDGTSGGGKVMRLLDSILPTDEEVELMKKIPHVEKMGEAENWVVSFSKIPKGKESVHYMSRLLSRLDHVRNTRCRARSA